MGIPSPFFTGRKEILQTLDAFFVSHHTGGSPRREFLLHGKAGVGKSEIAFKMAETLDFENRHVPHGASHPFHFFLTLGSNLCLGLSIFSTLTVPHSVQYTRAMLLLLCATDWAMGLQKRCAIEQCTGWKD
jgi:hypothetical protein